jgi:tetratricopeptide (TPR) repeat protein/O-antigen ligase
MLSAAAAKLTESGWLAAIVVVPILFNVHSESVFEQDKLSLLRSIAVVMAAGLFVHALEEGRRVWTVANRPIWHMPLVKPALLLTSAYCVSTFFSIAPRLSLLGSYERAQGTYTWLSYVTIFFAIILLVREQQQSQRVVTATILASLPPAAYAVVQHFGYDPIQWGSDVTGRAHGTTGNPIFLAAFLIMVVPLTLARVIDQLAYLGTRPRHGLRRLSHIGSGLPAAAYLVLLAVQLLAIVYTQSRGPFIGLAVGLSVFLIVFALRRGHRRLTATIATLAIIGSLFLAMFNLQQTPLQPLREWPYIARLGNLLETQSGTGKVRVLIWQGATALLAANPVRDLVGYGPETLFLAYSPFYPPELAHYESRTVAPDRSHNETLDSLAMTGIAGCVAQILLFVSFFYHVLRWLGMINTSKEGRIFLGTAAFGAVSGGILPYVIDGSFRFSGVALPFGIVAGLILYLLCAAVRQPDLVNSRPRSSNLLLIGLLAALLAHFIEIQLGIAVSMTRLCFWVYAALAVTVGELLCRREREAAGEAAYARKGPRQPSAEPSLSFTVGLILIVLTFDFYVPGFSARTQGIILLGLFLATWLFAALVVATDVPYSESAASHACTRVRACVAMSLPVWLVFTVIYVTWLNWQPGGGFTTDGMLRVGAHVADSVFILYGFVFIVIALTTAAALRGDRPPLMALSHTRRWRWGVCAMLLFTAALVIVRSNLNVSRANVLGKETEIYAHENRWDAARLVAEEALHLAPVADHYATELVQALTQLAQQTPPGEPQQRGGLLAQALVVAQGAEQTNPLNTDHARNLARLHHLWAGLLTDPVERSWHVEETHRWYAAALKLSPNNAALWNEWALLYLEQNDPAIALAILDESLRIDPAYTTTYWLRANAHLDAQQLDEALADYDRALAINPTLGAAWSGKALALARLNRFAEAIAANQQTLALVPNDLISHRNLAILYQQTGQLELAMAEAQAALAVAEARDQLALQALIEQLNEQLNEQHAREHPGDRP